MTRINWTQAMRDTLRKHYATMATTELAQLMSLPLGKVYAQAYRLGLRKCSDYYATDKCGRTFKGGTRGQATQFKPGQQPWNKGRLGWQAGGRSADTQFSTGMQPPNTMPVGSLRIVKGKKGTSQLERKIGTASGPNHMRWKAVHRLVWEAVNGPTPDGCIVVFRPGMKTLVEAEITIDKVECITRAENARRNDIKNRHPELAKLYQLKSAITRQINRIDKHHKEIHS